MSRALILPLLLAACAVPALPAPAPAAAGLMAAAQAQARPDRAVLVLFHASWCSWCRRLEGVLARPAVKEVLDRHFVIQWLTIKERGAKQELDNPGAAELYAGWTRGVESGIPFYAVLDAQGGLKASSIRALKAGEAPQNLGYPGSDAEIAGFLDLLREGAPGLTAAEAAVLVRELNDAKPKPKA